MKYNKMYFIIEVFENTGEINRQQFIEGCKKAGSNLDSENISRIFDKYSIEGEDLLDIDRIRDIYESK